MKKILGFCLLASLMASVAQGESYLYWMFNNADVDRWYADSDAFPRDNAVVKVRVVGEGVAEDTYLSIYGGSAWNQTAAFNDVYDNGDTGLGQYANLGSYASEAYSYMLELWAEGDDGSTYAGHSVSLSYASAMSMKYIALGELSEPPGGAWAAAFNIPEPTSGLLVLVGGALLALRRRRRIAA